MYRSFDNVIFDYKERLDTIDPILPAGMIVVCIDSGELKIGTGMMHWSEIQYSNSGVGSKAIVNRNPQNNELIYYNANSDLWDFRLQGKMETVSNWEYDNGVYPTFSMLVELSASNVPTGRFKIGDGVTQFNNLPWGGTDFDLSSFPTGYSIEFNGTFFAPQKYIKAGDSIRAAVPTGYKFARDDGEWASIDASYITGPISAVSGTIPLFNGTTGKSLYSSGVLLSSLPSTLGTPNTSFQIQIGAGPLLKNKTGVLEVRNALDTASGSMLIGEIFTDYLDVKNTLVIGYPTTEPASVSLTTDGTYLKVDGGIVYTSLTDGHDSGMDADTLDTYHASYFAPAAHTHAEIATMCRFRGVTSTIPGTPIAGDIWIDTSSGNIPKIYSGAAWIALV